MNPVLKDETSPPVSTMATPTNSSGNLVDEFEEAFQTCLNVLTKEEAIPAQDKDEIKVEVDQTTLRFIDLARQMEAFFLQKRFLLSALKPEMNVKEDISELRLELSRKEELLKRHQEKIAVWQNLLADLHSYAKSPAQAGSGTPTGATGSVLPTPQLPALPGSQPTPGAQMLPGIPSGMQQQLQQHQLQQLQMQQQQQQHMQQMQQMQVPPGLGGAGGSAAPGPVGPGMLSPQQAMFMQQQQQARGSPFPPQQGPAGNLLQGPLAYLEKTTSNIGMMDGRR